MEKELVRNLGELIGYGNMMQLASECWKESMVEKGYPTSGVFIPTLPCDVRGQNDETSENSLHKHVVMPPLLFNFRQRRKDLGLTLRKVEKHWNFKRLPKSA